MQEGERPPGSRVGSSAWAIPLALQRKKCRRPRVWAPRDTRRSPVASPGHGRPSIPGFPNLPSSRDGCWGPLLAARCAWPPGGSEPLGCACQIVSTSACCFSTAIAITEQPISVSVPVGYSFTLRCRAEGRTSLQYQWFCQHQVTVGAEVALSMAPGWVPARSDGAGPLRADLVGTRRLEGEGDRMRVHAEGFCRCWGAGVQWKSSFSCIPVAGGVEETKDFHFSCSYEGPAGAFYYQR